MSSLTSPVSNALNSIPDLNEGHPELYYKGIAATALAWAGYITPFFISFPLAETIQVVALGIITATTYGITNDLFGCRRCIEYFTIGHTTRHKRLLKTENPNLNALVWGIHASWREGLIAGVIMALAARATKLVAINAFYLTPFTFVIAVGTSIYAHYKSLNYEQRIKEDSSGLITQINFRNIIVPEPGYHPVDLRKIPEDKRAAYEGVARRNEIGYEYMAAGGAVLTIGTIAARVFLTLALPLV